MAAIVAADADWVLSAQLADGGICHYTDKVYLVPYFSSFGALGLARAAEATGDRRYLDGAWRWLDWYAAHMDSTGFVTDYTVAPDQTLTSTGSMDSTDSYAGMFLLAARRTWRVSGDTARLRTLAPALVLAVGAIEATQDVDGLTWAKPSWHVKYLMDQSETYAGLQACVDMASALDDTALQARALADSKRLAAGVAALWNPATAAYDWAVFDNGARQTCNWQVQYPGATSQVWAVAFGLARDGRAKTLINRFDTAFPLWDQTGYEPVIGLGFLQVGRTARAQLAAGRIRATAAAAGWAWPYMTAVAGELILLETTDRSYLAPLAR